MATSVIGLAVSLSLSQPPARPAGPHAASPITFEPNVGQTDPEVRFLTRRGSATVFLTTSESVFAGPDGAVRLRLDGANPNPSISGADPQPGRVNYLRGNDPTTWRTDVPTFSQVRYDDVYPGVDLVYYGNASHLEYDFEVAPGADPDLVAVHAEGARLDGQGNLIVRQGAAEIRQGRPVAYQEGGGRRTPVAASYRLGAGGRVTFRLGDYDRLQPLVIDPIIYSTFLGGSGNDHARGIAVDSAGNAYAVGYTASTDFPVRGTPKQGTYGLGAYDAYVAKLDPTGSTLLYSTFLGGSSQDVGAAIAVDSLGNAYVTGHTWSTNFPLAGAFQATHTPGMQHDAFVAKLNPTGSALVYSSYLGGDADDRANAIAVDGGGNAIVAGGTHSTNFPTAGSPLQARAHGGEDVFVAQVNPSGGALLYSTFLGGSSNEEASGLALDAAGNAYLAGSTLSHDFPVTAGALQLAHAGGDSDAFVAKVGPAGAALVYSTYLGGNHEESAAAIALDGAGAAYVGGGTVSTTFPLAVPLQAAKKGVQDGFVAKLTPSGSGLAYSTYLGGAANDQVRGLTVDGSGVAHVVGSTGSEDFPTVNAVRAAKAVGDDAFLAHVGASGSALSFSTYLGATGGMKVAIDRAGSDCIIGATGPADLPSAGPRAQPAFGGGDLDAFLMKVSAPAGRRPAVADFDGDRSTDVSVFRPSTGQWFIQGGATTGAAVAWGMSGDVPVPGDYDGDGRTDIAVYRPSNGTWFVRDDVTVGWGAGGDIPVAGDYDGNGTTDFAVYRPSSGQWFVRNGVNVVWGASGDVPVPGDYDGNGTTDIAVYRPSSGAWHVLSGTNAVWGVGGDVPQPGDYDGDGSTDIAVYRPSSGQWFVRNGVTATWGTGGDVPLPLATPTRLAFFP